MNPIKLIRESNHLSQKAAASLCGITEQVILKTEQGLYPTMPPSVLGAFAELGGCTQNELEYRYEKWIDEELLKVKLPTTIDIAHPSEFLHFRTIVCGINNMPDSVNAFCKLFKMNPYVIQKFEAGRLKQTPLQLVERIAYIKGEF